MIGNKYAGVAPWAFASCDVVVACCTRAELPDPEPSTAHTWQAADGCADADADVAADGADGGAEQRDSRSSGSGLVRQEVMRLPIPPGKKHKKELETCLAPALQRIRHHLAHKRRVLFVSDTGDDRAAGVAVAVLAAFFTPDLSVNWATPGAGRGTAAVATQHKEDGHAQGSTTTMDVSRPLLSKAEFTRCLQA